MICVIIMCVYMIGGSLVIKFIIQDSQFDCEYNMVHDSCNYYIYVYMIGCTSVIKFIIQYVLQFT